MRYIKQKCDRAPLDDASVRQTVASLIADVRARGDEALLEYEKRFGGSTRTEWRVSRDEIDEAYRSVAQSEIDDIRSALSNIAAFARAQRETIADLPSFEPRPGVKLSHKVSPVASTLCYVPGGNYPLYSTALMLITPAKAAGVRRVAACSPVMRGSDRVSPRTLVAMDAAGADEIYAVGGAQAIAAFSYGTDQIAPVDMIVGPGNAYVTEAKRECFGKVGIDFLAGPSEVLVIADGSADASVIAADLLAQSEHDISARGIVVATDEDLGRAIEREVARCLDELPTADVARASWDAGGEIAIADSIDEAIAYANDIAPEHLEIHAEIADEIAARLTAYGSLFVGGGTAEVFGDYASGTNHTLPTMRAARYTGGLWVGTFLRTATSQTMTKEAARDLAPLVARMARGEGLEAHARAAEARLKR